MDIIFVLAVAIFIEKSCSQVLTPSPTCYGDGDILKLECTTADFSQAINFLMDSVNQGGCSVGCAPNIAQSGTITTYTLSSFSSSTHSGNWTCSYGLSVSPVVIIAANPCVETTMGSIEGLETSTTLESSSIIEPTSTSIVVESNAEISWISPTDGSQLKTLDIFPFHSDFENFSSSIHFVTSDSKHTSASFEKDNLKTIDTTNASFFMHITSSVPNSLLSSMSLIQNLDSYKTNILSSMIKTETISPLIVTIESGYQLAFDSILTELTIGLLTSGLYITTSEISAGLIYSPLKSSFSVTPEVYPTSTYTETVSTDMTTSDKMFDIKETTAITPITAANVFTRDSLSGDISVLQTTFDSTTTSGSSIHQPMETFITSTAISYFFTPISEEAGFSSSFTLEAPRSTNTVLTTEEYESMMTSKLVYKNTSVFELASRIVPTNSQSSSEILLDSYYSVSTFISFLTTHEGPLINTNDPSFFKTESDMGLFNSSLVNPNFLLSLNATSNYIKEASDLQFNLSNPELSGTSSTIIFVKGDFSTTTLSYSSVIDAVKHTSEFVMSSSFNEQSVSETHNSFLSSLTIQSLIQTSSVRTIEAESAYTEMHSSFQTKLFSSIPDGIRETVYSTYDDKFLLLTSTEHILLVARSLNTLSSFADGIEDPVLITESFVEMISRSSNEMATSSSSLDKFSPDVKTTTKIQHGLSESSKDDIFISAVSGTIGAFILVVLIAVAVRKYFSKRNRFKDKEKEDEISKQPDWSDDSYSKNYMYTGREYPFNSGSIHLPLNSYESPYFPYANNYKKNWDDNT